MKIEPMSLKGYADMWREWLWCDLAPTLYHLGRLFVSRCGFCKKVDYVLWFSIGEHEEC